MPKQKEPTKLKLIKGNPSGKKIDRNAAEVVALEDITPPPELTDPDEIEAWKRIVPVLKSRGVVATSDVEALVLYCRTNATYLQAIAEVRRNGVTVPGATGGAIKNPASTVAQECGNLMYKILSGFGMTPSARPSADKVASSAPASSWDAFENQNG